MNPIFYNSRTISYLLFISLTIFILSACKKEDSKEVKFLSLNIAAIDLISGGGEAKIVVETNTNWTATSNQEWIKISPDKGQGNSDILIRYESNISQTPRVAEITILGDGVSKKIVSVTQAVSETLNSPTSISAEFNIDDNLVHISWKEVLGAERYRVYYSLKESGTYELLKEVKDTKFTDPVRNRYYKVTAIKGQIESEMSEFVVDSPIPPTQLSAIYESSTNSVKISWNSVLGATQYRVYSSSSLTNTFTLIAQTSQTSMQDNKRYAYYKISTVVNEIEGELSDYIMEPPSAPVNLSASYTKTENVVKISWDNVPIASSYKVYYSETLTGKFKLLKEVNSNSITDASRNRYYRVSAINKGGESGFRYKFSEKGRENAREPLVDIEGNVYRTVQIGNQIWMAENLRVTKTSAGEDIPMIAGADAWKALTFESIAFSYYNNSKELALSNNYGALYTWEAAKAACPKGWHLPTAEEWYELIEYVEKNNPIVANTVNDNSVLKSTTGWRTKPGTDDYGFGAVAAGYRFIPGGTSYVEFNGAERNAYWWGSTINNYNNDDAYSIGSYYYDGTLRNAHYVPKNDGISVRYVKD